MSDVRSAEKDARLRALADEWEASGYGMKEECARQLHAELDRPIPPEEPHHP